MCDDPRIGAVRAQAFTVPTDAPEADGTFAWDQTSMFQSLWRCGCSCPTTRRPIRRCGARQGARRHIRLAEETDRFGRDRPAAQPMPALRVRAGRCRVRQGSRVPPRPRRPEPSLGARPAADPKSVCRQRDDGHAYAHQGGRAPAQAPRALSAEPPGCGLVRLSPLSRCQVFAAAITSLNIVSLAVGGENAPFVRIVRY